MGNISRFCRRSFFSVWMVTAALGLAPAGANAALFNNGTADSVATVGSGGDYASLAAAATAFNGVAGGINANWEIRILGNLTEAANLSFANTVAAGKTVTIRPAPATTPTITFTQTADNTGPSGHLVIGSLHTAYTMFKMDGFTIDGSNTPGGSTRDLTITNSSASYTGSRLIMVVGDSDGVTVKNLNLINNNTNAGSSAYCVNFRLRVSSAPDNGLIQNNYLIAQGSAVGQGIFFDGSTATAAVGIVGTTIRDNLILARARGIFLTYVGNITIRDNRIRMNMTGGGTDCTGILLQPGTRRHRSRRSSTATASNRCRPQTQRQGSTRSASGLRTRPPPEGRLFTACTTTSSAASTMWGRRRPSRSAAA